MPDFALAKWYLVKIYDIAHVQYEGSSVHSGITSLYPTNVALSLVFFISTVHWNIIFLSLQRPPHFSYYFSSTVLNHFIYNLFPGFFPWELLFSFPTDEVNVFIHSYWAKVVAAAHQGVMPALLSMPQDRNEPSVIIFFNLSFVRLPLKERLDLHLLR